MKNLIPIVLLFLLSFVGYIQAQCPISAKIGLDSTCLFVAWEDDLEPPDTILLFGDTFANLNEIGVGLYGYSNIGPICGDTTGAQGFVSSMTYVIGEDEYTCAFDAGVYQPPCPDSAFIQDGEACFVFIIDTTNAAQFPDTIYLNGESELYLHAQMENQLFYGEPGGSCQLIDFDRTQLNDIVNMGPSVCEYQSGLLPITILAFDGTEKEGDIELSWKINSDEPTRSLVIQRSYNGIDWFDVYTQDLSDFGTDEIMDGRFLDQQVEQLQVYYRLQISGATGEATYSKVLPVSLENKVVNNLFYQSQSRSIMIRAGENFTGEMYLFNTQGQSVLQKQVQMQKNTYQEISIKGDLAPGIYFVKFDNGLIPPKKIFIDN